MNRAGGPKTGGDLEAWQRNYELLKARPAGVDCLPSLPAAPPQLQRVRFLAGKHPSLKVLGKEGRGVTLHSPRRAWEEAQELAQAAPLGRSRYVVALGLGLGYHLLTLLPLLNQDQHLIVVEKEPEVMWAALSTLDLTPLLSHPRTMLVVSPEAGKAVRHLQDKLLRRNRHHLSFWGHPPSLRSDQAYYQEVISRLKPSKRAPTRALGLKKETLRVLIVNPDYFLIPEVTRAFKQLGHQVHLSLFDKRRDRGDEVLRHILLEIREFSPDVVFTVNHLGFDREGLLLDTLHHLRVPSVSWYVDSPAIILSLYDGPKSDLAFIFVWDPTYIPEVQGLGFDRVFPLPLATDPGVFSPRRAGVRKKWRAPVAFVGNSLVSSVQKKLSRLPADEAFKKLYDGLCNASQGRPFRRLGSVLESEGLEGHPLIRGLNRQELSDLEAALLWRATLEYRLACLKELAAFRPTIYGDAGWRELVGEPFRLRPEVNYYDDLPRVYRSTDININATSLQMKAAVNQRVFDVPAVKGFLITDFREQLAELFKVGEEVVCFNEPGEIAELVRFYLKHPEARQRITARARARVLKEHTYQHRVAVMLRTLRREL